MKIDNSPARGTRDLLPADVAVRDHVLSTITSVYRRFGYQRIETPALEDIRRLTGGQGGDNEKLIFQILRRGLPNRVDAETDLADLVEFGLRYDLTVPLSRFFGHNQAKLPLPLRSFQFGPVWRAERPQRGRYRQFYQCDIDMVGEPSVLAEAELIEATALALRAVGLTETTVRLSDRRFLTALAGFAGVPEDATGSFFITLDKLDKIGWDGVREELLSRGLDDRVVATALDIVTELGEVSSDKVVNHLSNVLPTLADDVLDDLGTTTACLNRVAVAGGELRWTFDATLVRGMGYYTGQIFEISVSGVGSSVAGGGRYDKLIGRSLGKDVPACGFSIGFERIVDLLSAAPRQESLALLCESDVSTVVALDAARRIRTDDRPVSVVRRQGKFGAQLSRLEDWGFTAFVHVRTDADADDALPTERALGTPGNA